MIKSNLRWAGGKSRMITILDEFMPDKIDKYLDVFLGGGSVLLHIIQKYKPTEIIANDIDVNLINYFNEIKKDPNKVIGGCLKIKSNYNSDNFKEIFSKLDIENATDFFIANKTSFSGLNSNYSRLAYDRNFTINCINKIKDISNMVQSVEFISKDFKDLNLDLNDYFLYLDPPYYSNKEKGLYGEKGELHKQFDHESLFKWVEHYGKNNKIMISYDDCAYIRNLYKDYHIYNFDFVYSMTNTGGHKCKKGREIVITNYKVENKGESKMRLYSENKDYKLYQGNMLDMLEVIEPNSIDSIVTDPPYGLTNITKKSDKDDNSQKTTKGFMGKEWDGSGIEYNIDTWKNCYEVLKPGGYLLAFGGSRTFYRIACAIEDAGFEIRDTIMWLYGSGFPKSMNLGLAIDKKNGVESKVVGYADTTMPDFRDVGKKQKEISGIDKLTFGQIENSERKATPIYEAQNDWQGWGTALKPSFEPIIVARKPFKGSLVDNVIENGVGGINIDECRVGTEERTQFSGRSQSKTTVYNAYNQDNAHYETVQGRFPANTIIDEEVAESMPEGSHTGHRSQTSIDNCINNRKKRKGTTQCDVGGNISKITEYTDSGSVSRYFYCAKASKKDRDEGLSEFADKVKVFNGKSDTSSIDMKDVEQRFTTVGKNTHPTVKPCDLMQYLVRLVTPNGGTVLDPFNGSGSTGKAAMYENKERNKNYKYIGIELTEEYLPISKARIEYVSNLVNEELKEEQLSLFEEEN